MGQRLSRRRNKAKAKKERRYQANAGNWHDDTTPRQPRQFNSAQDINDDDAAIFAAFASFPSPVTSLPDVSNAHISRLLLPPVKQHVVAQPRHVAAVLPTQNNIFKHRQDRSSVTHLLRGCATRNIGHTAGVPVLRGCPRCGVLVSVDGDNKHVRCLVCDSQFCFVCLQLSRSSGGRGCGAVCAVAPRQKDLLRLRDEEMLAQMEYWSQADDDDDLNLAIRLSEFSELDAMRNVDLNDSEDAVGSIRASSVVVDTSELRPLQGYIQLTKESCCVTLEDSDVNRAKMPCGHVISVEGLKHLAHSAIVTNRGHQIQCPECEAEWEFFLVRHVLSATITPAELLEMAQSMSINKLAADDIKSCPNCATSYVKEADMEGNRVVCVFCSEELQKPVAFCWNCLQEWKGDRDSTNCGNAACDTTDWRLRELATCGTTTIGQVSGVPKLRGCENCGALIEHREACKHMTCHAPGCTKYSFCFVCLKPCVNGAFQCGRYSDPCQIAPRQTSLPN